MGFTNTPQSSYDSLVKRFHTSYVINTVTGCWEYQGDFDIHGYGRAYRFINKKRIRYPAHRMSYCIANNIPVDGLSPTIVIRHTCDNPACVNPNHLISGTQLENVQDMMNRGRNNQCKGEQNGQSKFTNDQIMYIRSRFAIGDISYRKLSQEFNCTASNIRSIIKYKTWKHLF